MNPKPNRNEKMRQRIRAKGQAGVCIRSIGACLSILRGRDRGRFPLRQGGADAVGYAPNKEATTPHEGKSARSRRVGKAVCPCATVVPWQANGSVRGGVCGVARLV